MSSPTSPEVELIRLRPHARALILPTGLLVILTGAAFYVAGATASTVPAALVAAVAGALIFVGWLLPLWRWLAARYTITSRRLIVLDGMMVRTRHEVLLSKVAQVSVRKTLLQRLFSCGDIIVDSAGSQPIVLRDVPWATLVQQSLHDLAE